MIELAVWSAAFVLGTTIPDRLACAGGISPALERAEVPANTQSIAVLCAATDAPGGDWVRLDLEAQARKSDLVRALQHHVTAQGAPMGTSARKPRP